MPICYNHRSKSDKLEGLNGLNLFEISRYESRDEFIVKNYVLEKYGELYSFRRYILERFYSEYWVYK